ncbi:MAG: hypothetical protein ABMA13_07110 [Chthoniobacteraceae bacterium]
MNAESARQLIPLYRPGKQMDPRVIKAVRFAEADPTLRDELEWQMEFDDEIVEVIHCIRPPENLRQKLDELSGVAADANGRGRVRLFNPAVLSAIFGVLLFAGFLVYLKMESAKDFPGRNWAVSLLQINDRMTGAELEMTKLPAGDLADNMMLRGFDRFTLPAELATQPAVGWSVFRHSGNKVAQVAIDRNSLIVFVFRASDFGVYPDKAKGWKVFEHERWVAAATERDGLCTLISFRGDTAAMERFLQSIKP